MNIMDEAWIKLLKADPERQVDYRLPTKTDPMTGEKRKLMHQGKFSCLTKESRQRMKMKNSLAIVKWQ